MANLAGLYAGTMFDLKFDASQIDQKLANVLKAAGPKIPLAMIRAVNHTGPIARTAMIRALVPQTGLKRKTMDKALKQKLSFNGGNYEIYSRGGNVRLQFFRPRETRKGLVAKPWNKKTLYPGVFMKGGRFPKRHGGIGAPVQRAGKARLPLKAAPRSGLFIPEEMVKGNSEAVFFSTVSTRLPDRLAHELYRIIGA